MGKLCHPIMSCTCLQDYAEVVWDSRSLGLRPKPTPARIASSTGSDPRWGWFGSGTETRADSNSVLWAHAVSFRAYIELI